MNNLFKLLPLVRRKPLLLWRGAKAACLSNILGRDVLRGAEMAVTYKCQAQCEKCSSRALKDPGRVEISEDEIIKNSQKIVKAGGLLINLTGGEPLLRGDIVSIVAKLNRMPVFISLASNALLLTDAILEDLRKAGLNMIQIGFNSPFENEHDAEIGVEGSFKKIWASVGKARKLGLQVLFNTVVTRSILYSDRLKMMVAMAQEQGCYLSLILPASVGGWQGKDVNLNSKDFEHLKTWLRYTHVTIDTETCYHRGLCPAGTEKIYVNPYGDVYPCPFIHNKYGNALQDDFFNILRAMRESRINGCVNCASV